MTKRAFEGKEYYLPKALTLTSPMALFEELEIILESIKQRLDEEDSAFLFNTYLAYLTHMAPLPAPGTEIVYNLCGDTNTFSISMPHINEFPKVSEDAYLKFFERKFLSFNKFTDVLYWFMAQVGSVIVISSDEDKISTTTEVLRTIIFPFVYDDPYMLALPKGYMNYLNAPFPCLIGMVVESKEEFSQVGGK